jgi:hypothetical protein
MSESDSLHAFLNSLPMMVMAFSRIVWTLSSVALGQRARIVASSRSGENCFQHRGKRGHEPDVFDTRLSNLEATARRAGNKNPAFQGESIKHCDGGRGMAGRALGSRAAKSGCDAARVYPGAAPCVAT